MIKVLIMAGGRGSRLGGTEKGLLRVCGGTVISRTLDLSLEISDEVFVVISKRSKVLRSYLKAFRPNVEIVEGTGEDYVHDLSQALSFIGEFPVLVLPSDMPFLSQRVIRPLMESLWKDPKAIVNVTISKRCKAYRKRGPTGVSLFSTFKGPWKDLEMCIYPDLLDIDFPEDLEEARFLCLRGFTEELAGRRK